MIQRLMDFIHQSTSVYHVSEQFKELLVAKKYVQLDIEKPFNIKKGGKYFVSKDGATIAFRIDGLEGFKMVVSHTDSPSIKIKSNADVFANGYHLLNVEVYGGPILNTWFDKPLSIAGVVQFH